MEKEISILQETELFKNLTSAQIRKVLNICRTITFSEDEIIMNEGETGDKMYIILEGTVEVIKKLIMDGGEDEGTVGKNKIYTRLDARQRADLGRGGLPDAR